MARQIRQLQLKWSVRIFAVMIGCSMVSGTPQPHGTLSGTLFTIRSGHGIAAALVEVEKAGLSTYTLPDGSFTFPRLSPGSWRLKVSNSTLGLLKAECEIRSGQETYLKLGIDSVQALNVSTSYSDLPSGIIRGQVFAGTPKKPVADALVRISGLNVTARTDSSGSYLLENIGAGEYTVTAEIAGCPLWTQPVTVTAGVERSLDIVTGLSRAARKNQTLLPTAQGTMIGTLLDSRSNRPVSAATIVIRNGRPVHTDEGGSFRIPDLPGGCHDLSIQAAGFADMQIPGVPVLPLQVTTVTIYCNAAGACEYNLVIAPWQPGRIALTILDAQTSLPLPGATVYVEGVEGHYASDSLGTVFINEVPTSSYTARVTCDGYVPFDISVIRVIENRTSRYTVRMIPPGAQAPDDTLHAVTSAFEHDAPQTAPVATAASPGTSGPAVAAVPPPAESPGSESIRDLGLTRIRSTAVRSSNAAVLQARKDAFVINDGIAHEQISRSGAGNVAAAIKQIPGITVQDGKYVVIRGLSERYVLTTLNGLTLPSPDPDKRAVPLDMFPTALIDNIVTSKAFTADQPGNFSGGNVNIVTRAIPDKLTFSGSLSMGADRDVFTTRDNLTVRGGRLDWLGIDDGTRARPALFDSITSIPHYILARKDSEQAALIDQTSKAFESGFVPERSNKAPDFGFNATLANRFAVKNQTLGGLLSLTYSNNRNFYNDGINSRYRYQQVAGLGDYDELYAVRAYTEDRSSTDLLWGGLGAVTWEPRSHQKLNATCLYVHNAENDFRYARGIIDNLEEGRVAEYYSILYSERNLSLLQATGTHQLPARLQFEWRLAQAWTRQNQPDQRTMMLNRYLQPDETGSYGYRSHENILPVKNPERYFRDLNEKSFQTSTDLVFYPFGHDSRRSFIRAGWTTVMRERSYRVSRYFYEPVRAGGVTLDNAGGPEHYFDPQNLGIVDTAINGTDTSYVFGLIVYQGDNQSVNYDARRTIPGYFLMCNLSPVTWLDLSGGIRRETTRMSLKNHKDVSISRDYADLLPCAGLAFSFTSDIKLRAQYGKTLAQPSERELAPYGNFDPAENVAFVGNPDLDQTTIHNFDLRMEWFQNVTGLIAVSGFYKKFIKPIEKVVVDNNGTIRYRNFDDNAQVFGIEVEGRYDLGRLHRHLQGLTAGGNAALISSRLTIDEREYRDRLRFDPDASQIRQLQGQSPWIVNAFIDHDSEPLGMRSSLNLHLMGPTIMVVSSGNSPDSYSSPHPYFNLSLSKKINRHFSVEGGIANLFGDHRRVANRFADNEFVNIEQIRSRSYRLKLGYTF